MSRTITTAEQLTIDCIVTGELEVNTFFIRSATDLIIIDPGGDPEQIIAEAAATPNILVLLTHNHYDHSGATNEILAALPRAKFAAHAECIRLASNKKHNLCQFLMQLDYELTQRPDFLIKHNDIITEGALTLQALHSSGHSPGHLCYWLESANSLFCGDLLTAEDIGRHDVPGSNLTAMIADCRALLANIPDHTLIYPGHGSPITAQEVKQTNPRLRKYYN